MAANLEFTDKIYRASSDFNKFSWCYRLSINSVLISLKQTKNDGIMQF